MAELEKSKASDQRGLVKTKTPGIFRRGDSYVVTYRHQGKQRKRFARTYEEALDVKAILRADKRRGAHRENSVLTFEEYARDWINTYMGRTNRGFRESTREGYRFSIEHRAIPFFSKRTDTLAGIEPSDVRAFVKWLFEQEVSGRPPAVSTVRGHVAAVKVLFATAMEDRKINYNPATGVRIVGGTPVKRDAAEIRKALDSDELEGSSRPARRSGGCSSGCWR